MSSEFETKNIFKFDSQDILKFYTSPIKSQKLPYSPTFSPNNKLVSEKEKKCIKYNIVNLVSSPNQGAKFQNNKSKLFYFKIIISIFLINFLIYYFDFDDVLPYKIIYDSNYEKLLEEIPEENNEVFKRKEFGIFKTYLAFNIIKKFNDYIDTCIKGELLDHNKYYLPTEPKISVLMPLYKGGKYLHYSLRSIQNQKMKDIEIILVDDNSQDDTSLIINKYMKEDPRIKLIQNEVNRKVLYSKSMAALNAKGKYIVQLDQDDIFIRDDLFDILYEEAEKNDLDIIQFRDITKNSFHLNKKTIVNCVGRHYILPKYNHFKTQPELKDTMYTNNNVFLLWGLLINTNIYKKAIYYLWKIIINYQIIFHEDYLILCIIIILSRNYKYMNLFSMIHLNNINSSSNKHWNLKDYYLSVLFFVNIISDYYIKYNPSDVKILINFFHLFIKEFDKGKSMYPNLFETTINKILYNRYIPLDEKNFIIHKFRIIKNDSNLISPTDLNSIGTFQNLSSYNITIFNENSNSYNISISIVIICQQFKYLDKTIYSIENQNFSNYEIILIYDKEHENNDESNIIKDFIKKYPNINFIYNSPKKGKLNSIISSIQLCKGENLIILEPGYTLAQNISLDEYNYYMINSNEDILEFNLLINNEYEIKKENLMIYKCAHYKSKIEEIINNIKFKKNIRELDQQKDLLFNKIIKKKVLQNVIEKYKLNYNEKTIDNYYNEIILFSLTISNITFRHIDAYGIIQYSPYIEELNKNSNNNKNIIDESIFYINYIYDNTNNSTFDKEYVLHKYFDLLAIIYNKHNIVSNEASKLYKKFYLSDLISPFNKRLLKTYFHSLRE
jgi:glycosyltransferase involved in cell wall biosynthesis